MKNLADDDLILFFYGEAENSDEIRERLAASAELRARYEALQRVLSAVDALPVPERPPSYGAQVWARLQPRLAAPERRSWWPAFGGLNWAWGALAAATLLLLAAGFLAGRLWPRPAGEGVEMAGAPSAFSTGARERIFTETVATHLERSERLLVEVANTGPAGEELAAERAWAQDLLLANRIYRQSARQTGRSRLAAFLDELEPILLELAHTPAEPSAGEVDDLRQRIEDSSLLFKMRVVSSRLERQATRHHPDSKPDPNRRLTL
jgi:hypothetical protein